MTVGLERSPTGLVAGWLTRRQPPQWVSAKPKRFAWTLGLGMALAMTVVTNDGIHGAWPRTICLICLALMWLEAVLGLCLGCELYGLMVRRGLAPPRRRLRGLRRRSLRSRSLTGVTGAPRLRRWSGPRP